MTWIVLNESYDAGYRAGVFVRHYWPWGIVALFLVITLVVALWANSRAQHHDRTPAI